MKKILIANRGEIALRVVRACHLLGIKTIAVHSTCDQNLMHVRFADESVCIGPPLASKSYLHIPNIISAAELTNADAIHPGYGFLSEHAGFAAQSERSGFIFIGPDPQTIATMGDKIMAKQTMQQLGIPCVPGIAEALSTSALELGISYAEEIGYPIIMKAAGGGGGRGMRVVTDPSQFLSALQLTQSEALQAFGHADIYLEKYLSHPRHIEIQILADGRGKAISLGERDCSWQRRHQKIIEEAPAYGVSEKERMDIAKKCCDAAIHLNYRGLGTFEFLYQDQQFYFIEMNTRIQVEHPVTEMVTGIDLVAEQIRISAGEELKIKQEHVKPKGVAIECRINAEHPFHFRPSPGVIHRLHLPSGPWIRVDSHLYQGYEVPPYYDSLIAKVIVWGNTRSEAIARMKQALHETVIDGISTNIPLHLEMMNHDGYCQGQNDIHFVMRWLHQAGHIT